MQNTIEKENYLKVVYKMEEKSQKTSVTFLSKHFNVSKSTVSNMIKKLVVMNLIENRPYKPIILTKNGRQDALKIIAKHRLIELYLVEKMQFSLDEVHDIAEEIEHIKNKKFFKRMKKILGNAKIDPHGSIIPKYDF